MKIASVETLHCDAGWRPWTFIKITTDDGLVGWSECTDSHGSPLGLEGVVKTLTPHLLGKDARRTESLFQLMYARTRQSPGSIIQKAIGGIENALLDIKAKALGVPVYELFGGPVRDTIPLYWSHWGTPQMRAAKFIKKPPIKTVEDVHALGKETQKSGYSAIKPKVALFGEKELSIHMPGFGESDGWPELNADRSVLQGVEQWIDTLEKAVGKDIDIILDLNFNFKAEGLIKAGRMLEKHNLMWLEVDTFNPDTLRIIRDSVRMPIASCENIYGPGGYLPYFEKHAMDIAVIDIIWNGFIRSKQIADLADVHEMNVAPHNHSGHLATFISAHFSAVVPNLRIMEYDVDDVPWRETLFTNTPKIKKGTMELPKGPGWGTEVNEKVLREHLWPHQA